MCEMAISMHVHMVSKISLTCRLVSLPVNAYLLTGELYVSSCNRRRPVLQFLYHFALGSFFCYFETMTLRLEYGVLGLRERQYPAIMALPSR